MIIMIRMTGDLWVVGTRLSGVSVQEPSSKPSGSQASNAAVLPGGAVEDPGSKGKDWISRLKFRYLQNLHDLGLMDPPKMFSDQRGPQVIMTLVKGYCMF